MTLGCNSQIYWSSDNLLDWKDFKAEPKKKRFDANSSVGIKYEYKELKDRRIKLTLYSFFDRKKSWVNIRGKNNKLLIHEQLHFNITELHSRKIRKAVIEDSSINGKNFNNKFKEIYKFYLQEEDNMQLNYDKETDHSRNFEKQKEWEDKITKELEELKEYTDPEIIIE